MDEYQEQKAIAQIALARHPEAISVKDVQPFLMASKEFDCWLVILTTAVEHQFITELITAEDIERSRDHGNA